MCLNFLEKDNDKEEEDNEVIKAILNSQKLQTNRPPSVVLEDTITDICFHPTVNNIGVASITGDVFM